MNKPKTVTYWIACTGSFGSFRTVTTTETLEDFFNWVNKYGFKKEKDGYWRNSQGATVNFEKGRHLV